MTAIFDLTLKIGEGKEFPPDPSKKILFQATVHDSTELTPAVSQKIKPKFNSTLHWVLPEYFVNRVRTRRTPVKLVCFQLDSGQRKKPLGFIMIDFRKALKSNEEFEWVPLQNTRQHKSPEISLCATLSETVSMDSSLNQNRLLSGSKSVNAPQDDVSEISYDQDYENDFF
eukprot:GCRY01008315.1.p1 GENE.GCRY01008315.1~~GCRY01008315.1.p1  ORF type:complete len:171 (+),score=17.89 GCRY01008315.1:114-626(+)